MAVDPKLVGGGAAVVAIGGGSGYAISQAASSSKDNSNSSPDQTNEGDGAKADPKTVVKSKLEALKFEINEEESECSEKLTELTTDAHLKAIVKACYKNKKLSDRAKKFGLDVLEESNLENGGWDTWWGNETNKNEAKTAFSGSADGWTTAKDPLKTFCTTTGNKNIDDQTQNNDWEKFLKACTKDKTNDTGKKNKVKAKDFWALDSIQ